MAKNSIFWDLEAVEQCKLSIKADIDKLLETGSPKGRLDHILKQISKLSDGQEELSSLQCYVYGMSALVHHERYSGLTQKQIKDLTQLLYDLLTIGRVSPGEGKSAVLFRDVHLVLSQIYRRDGEFWQALWEQSRAASMASYSKVQNPGFMELSQAIRAFRLGNMSKGLRLITTAASLTTDSFQKTRVQLELTKALRLSGDYDEAFRTANEALAMELSDKYRKEFEWELICIKAQQTGDLLQMIVQTQSGKKHYDMDYALEATLWSLVHPKMQWLERLPKVSTLINRTDLNVNSKSLLLLCTRTLFECYDSTILMHHRMNQLGKMLVDCKKLITLDLEILCWAAAARFLSRRKMTDLAGIVLDEYRQKSLRLSNGNSIDVLNMMGDLLEKQEIKKSA